MLAKTSSTSKILKYIGMEVPKCSKQGSIHGVKQGIFACNKKMHNCNPTKMKDVGRGVVPARVEPPEGEHGSTADHFLRSCLLWLLSSPSPRDPRDNYLQQ